MEVRSTRQYAGWYGSYLEDQGRCLVNALKERQIQLEELLESILAEIELTDDPRECSPETAL